jgi:hypothetical protein
VSDLPAGSSKPPHLGAPGFAESYWIELLYDKVPALDGRALVERLGAATPVELIASAVGDEGGAIALGHIGSLVEIEGAGKLPSITNIAWGNTRVNLTDYKAALDQTWDWDGARKALGRCWHSLLVGDITGSRLPYPERYRLLKAVAVATAELTKPHVCHWKEAGCLVDPGRLGERLDTVCNVRRFKVALREEHFMDTLGLAAIGLPDVQMRFTRLEPGFVAGWMNSVGIYMFERGDVIADGDVIPSPVPGEHWAGSHQMATVPPQRIVVNITPSPKYAGSESPVERR